MFNLHRHRFSFADLILAHPTILLMHFQMMRVRRMLTEVLLDVTNSEALSVAEEVFAKRKRKGEELNRLFVSGFDIYEAHLEEEVRGKLEMSQHQICLDLGRSVKAKDSLVCRFCCYLMSCIFLGGPIAQANAIAKPNSSTSQFGKFLNSLAVLVISAIYIYIIYVQCRVLRIQLSFCNIYIYCVVLKRP